VQEIISCWGAGATPRNDGLLIGIFDSVMRATLAYRFQRKTQAKLAFKSTLFVGVAHTHKEQSPLTLSSSTLLGLSVSVTLTEKPVLVYRKNGFIFILNYLTTF
jgi:hypothetical protein